MTYLNQGTRIIAVVMMAPETSVCLNELQSLLSAEGMQIKVLVLSTPVLLLKHVCDECCIGIKAFKIYRETVLS